MLYEYGTEFVLISSFASYEILQAVSMFPEVFYPFLDGSQRHKWTNSYQNISVLPSETKWNKISMVKRQSHNIM